MKNVLLLIGLTFLVFNICADDNIFFRQIEIMTKTNDSLMSCIKKSDQSDFEMMECNFSATRRLDTYIYDSIYKKQLNLKNNFNLNRKDFCIKTNSFTGGALDRVNQSSCNYYFSVKEILKNLYQMKDMILLHKKLWIKSNLSSNVLAEEINKINNECKNTSVYWSELVDDKSIEKDVLMDCINTAAIKNILKLIK